MPPPIPPPRRLCCLCGTSIQSNPSNMCVNCLRSQVDITEGIQKQVRGGGHHSGHPEAGEMGVDITGGIQKQVRGAAAAVVRVRGGT